MAQNSYFRMLGLSHGGQYLSQWFSVFIVARNVASVQDFVLCFVILSEAVCAQEASGVCQGDKTPCTSVLEG